jgi:hypothetical protein
MKTMNSATTFVSYSSKDKLFAIGFAKELQNLGVDTWIDQLEIKLGKNWDNSIEEALDKSDTLILMISPSSVGSPNVQDEVSIAIKSEKKIVPILIKKCDLPMRWQRKQYADLTQNPEKGLMEIIEFLNLKEEGALQKLKDLLSLIEISSASNQHVVQKIESNLNQEKEQKRDLEDLLTSEEEISFATEMKQKGIKSNKLLIIFVAILSIILLVVLCFMTSSIDRGMIIIGCLFINLLSIVPFGNIRKRKRIINLMTLLKLKRGRLIRIMNKITEKEVDEFNLEFRNYISM